MANDPILPQPDVLNQVSYGKFVLTNLAAKRAKQIKEGAPPLVRINSNHPLSIALAEIAAGKIKPIIGEESEAIVTERIDGLDELDRRSFLLPGLDDEEGLLDDLDADEEDEGAVAPISLLGELLEEEEVEAEIEDTGEISLDDLAKQEEDEDDSAAVTE